MSDHEPTGTPSGASTSEGIFRPGAVEHAIHEPEILAAKQKGPTLAPAQRVNLLSLTAWAYEPVWRKQSVSILTSGQFSTEDELRAMIQWVDPKPGETFLDAGCSAGLYARTIQRKQPDARVHAVDISRPFLRRAGVLARREGMDVRLLEANVELLPYRDAVFDGIVSGGSLNEFRNPQRAFAEFARTLAPGGRVFLMYVARSHTPVGRALQRVMGWSGLHFPTPEDVDTWASDVGWKKVRDRSHPPLTLSLYRSPTATGRTGSPG